MNEPGNKAVYQRFGLEFGFTPVQIVILMASIAAGLSYPAIEGRFGTGVDIAAKGLGVTALAAAAIAGRHYWLAAIMAAGAVGDMVLELPGGLVPGGAAFAVGHVVAIVYYTRNNRPAHPPSNWGPPVMLVGYGLAMPALLMPPNADYFGVAVYSLLLCLMAAAAWRSRFPRDRLALGALLFVASDTLLIMRLGDRLIGGAAMHGLLVWYSYYLGQLGIFLGAAQRLPQYDD